MKEEFLHYIFRNKLWSNKDMVLVDGRKFEIIDVGQYNYDSGPDFFNGKIKIEDTIWAGNIEIHINSSDWFKHNHQTNLAYSNVILHVVYNNDRDITLPDSSTIPSWEIEFPHILLNKYLELKNNEKDIPCEEYIDLVDKFKLGFWIEKMGVERLQHKSEIIDTYLEKSNNDWEYAFYVSLCRSFGSGLNAFAFEQLAMNTPLKLVRKYNKDKFKLEALLFGQSGLLENAIVDNYVIKLRKEYDYLRVLHKLTPITSAYWKFSKLRPSNFPQIKIAQLVSILSDFQGLFSEIITKPEYVKIRSFFKPKVNEYWKTHYVFGKPVEKAFCGFGKSSFDTLIINTISPFVFKYYRVHKESNDNKHYNILTGLKPEDNRHIRVWKKIGIEPNDSFGSQALLHLKKEYCDKKKCLSCQIGNEIMQQISKI